MIRQAFTVHDAQVMVWHAWQDGMPIRGPLGRHSYVPAAQQFRAGLSIRSVARPATDPAFGQWQRHSTPEGVYPAEEWQVEIASVLGQEESDGALISQLLRPGSPVVVVVMFAVKGTSEWRILQFHDAELMPLESGEESQVMRRNLRFSAGWMEEFKSGSMPGSMQPRIRGIIEWCHAGRTVRCWEYDPYENTWTEDPENQILIGEETARYISFDTPSSGARRLGMMAALTESMPLPLGGTETGGTGIFWRHVWLLDIPATGPLQMAPGWITESHGLAEPLLLPPSGLHWEHPRLVLRVLGRIYATACAGVLAVPRIHYGAVPDAPSDPPIRLGRWVLYPDASWILPA
jgi:hypothetical protein